VKPSEPSSTAAIPLRDHGKLYDPSVSISNPELTTSCVSAGRVHDVAEDAAIEDVVEEEVVVEDAAAEDVVVEVEVVLEDRLEDVDGAAEDEDSVLDVVNDAATDELLWDEVEKA
jgi:hypothetical protein